MPLGTKTCLLGLCIIGNALRASAHGLVESPPSRNWICGAVTKPNEVDNGTAQHPICADAFKPNPIAAYNLMAVVTPTLGRAHGMARIARRLPVVTHT